MAQSFQLEGTIKQIDEIQTFSSGFSKREFVVEVEDGKFPQFIKFECVKEKASLTDGYGVGDTVRVHFDIRGNEYKGRYYVNLNAWKIENPEKGGQSSGQKNTDWGDDAPIREAPDGYGQESSDDIPF